MASRALGSNLFGFFFVWKQCKLLEQPSAFKSFFYVEGDCNVAVQTVSL